MPSKECNRRNFLKTNIAAGVTAALVGMTGAGCGTAMGKGRRLTQPSSYTYPFFRTPPMKQVRIGFVGVGGQGSNHVRNLLKIPGAQLKAVCDIVPSKVARIQKWTQQAGQPKPKGYTRGPRDFERMCREEDLDLVYTATPWQWHVPVCVAAMKNGKHAATEVPMAITTEGCWELIETAEKYQKHCVMMENCCYDRVELMILNMVRKGLLGTLLHGECGYLHDLRGVKFSKYGEGLWRRAYSRTENGDLYPTHGLGPVAQCMNINRGNKFTYMVSMASASLGLHEYAVKHFGPNSPQAREKFKLGDVVTTMIRTNDNQTIIVTHETNLPKPYSRGIVVQGTRGLVRKYPTPKIYIEGVSHGEAWEDLLPKYSRQYEHPLWKRMERLSRGAGHGGMDYIEDYRLIECLLKGEPTDFDVYDGAAWSVIRPLSEISIANKSQAVDIPDFTRGVWKKRPPLGIIGG